MIYSMTFKKYMFTFICNLSLWISEFRSVISGVIRQATVLNPKYTFQLAVTWLESQLQKPIETGPGNGNQSLLSTISACLISQKIELFNINIFISLFDTQSFCNQWDLIGYNCGFNDGYSKFNENV